MKLKYSCKRCKMILFVFTRTKEDRTSFKTGNIHNGGKKLEFKTVQVKDNFFNRNINLTGDRPSWSRDSPVLLVHTHWQHPAVHLSKPRSVWGGRLRLHLKRAIKLKKKKISKISQMSTTPP